MFFLFGAAGPHFDRVKLGKMSFSGKSVATVRLMVRGSRISCRRSSIENCEGNIYEGC